MASSLSPSTVSRTGIAIHASHVVVVHTYLAFAAFLSALVIGCALHYKKIVKNGVAGYPEEWFPSVSATIGDWYPERNIFQIFIAMNSGPRLALVFLQYYLHRHAGSSLPGVVLFFGVLRTLSCGGWVYITSNDDHDVHDILMVTYIVCNIPWMFGSIACTPRNTKARSRRQYMASLFFLSMIPMIYFFIQHKIKQIPGAYTRYSFFEWGLIFFDVLFDSSAKPEFEAANLQFFLGMGLNDVTPAEDIVPHKVSTTASTSVAEVNDLAHEEPVSPPHCTLPGVLTRLRANPVLALLSDLYLSFLFWSIYTSLIPTLFYFSVWELGIAGHELALLSSLAPFSLAIPPFLAWARTRDGRTVLHVLSLAGLAAYALESPLYRLFAVAAASAIVTIGAAVDWAGDSEYGGEGGAGYQAILTGLGFLLTSLAKHANHANNPVWPNVDAKSGGFNKTGFLLGVLAICNFYIRVQSPQPQHPASSNAVLRKEHENGSGWLAPSIALGGLLFTLHALLSDASTLIAWSWTGYPIRGPVPNLHGSLTHVAQAAGLGLSYIFAFRSSPSPSASSSAGQHILTHPLWHMYGSASAYVTYMYRDWLGHTGALNLAVFLMSSIPLVLRGASAAARGRGGVARTFGVAMLVVCLFDLASVWTVAYAFVPGGEYLRERTDLVLIVQMACISMAFVSPRVTPRLRALPLPVPALTRAYAFAALAFMTILSLLATMYRWPTVVPQPHRPGPRILRAGIWTVHFGIDNEGRDSQRRMRDLIKDMELDVVGLLETDLHRVVFGNRDLTRVIAEELGFYVDIGPGPNKHTWGAVLLSKFPIINSTHHLLPSPVGELAPAIEAVLDVFGTEVTVIVAHNGQEETPLDRELQATELARIMSKSYPQPLIYLGYVVTKPHAPRPAPYDIMVTDGRVNDIDKDDWDRWCEYIFYRGLYRTSYARISRSTITDTELQVGQFVLPKYGFGVPDNLEEDAYLRAWKEELSEDHWFPMEYYLEIGGMRGHHYHVFNTPLYYKIPEAAIV